MKEKKGSVSILLTLMICIFSVLLTGRPALAVLTSGDVGQNAHWSFDMGAGILTIDGSGDTYSYKNAADIPWSAHKQDIVKITVKDGITGIGDYLFAECASAIEIQLPASVKTIGQYAFFACNEMKKITLPAGIPEIGNDTFAYCSELTEITIPKSVTRIGDGAFRSCDALTAFALERGSKLTQAGTLIFRVYPYEPWKNGRKITWYASDTVAAYVMKKVRSEWNAYVLEAGTATCNWQWSELTYAKVKNPLAVKAKTAVIKAGKLKKKKQTLAVSKIIRFTGKGQGEIKYKLVSAKKGKKSYKKYFKINAKTGKVTLKKGLGKGTYKVKVKVRAAGNDDYKASDWQTVTCKVKIK